MKWLLAERRYSQRLLWVSVPSAQASPSMRIQAAGNIGICFQLSWLKTRSNHDEIVGVAMQEIADWLEKLGMSQYTQRFAENDVDVRALRYLTDQDLKEIGVSLGHRRRMLAAIAELAEAVPAALPRTAPELEPQSTAELRQLTIMFTDLVGPTALSTKLDLEDMRFVIGAYHKCVAETVARFDGFVARYMGDGVLVYFGYPHAHEDDVERAVRSGLALVEAVDKLPIEEPVQVRIGVATGLVVVGDLVGSGEAQERGVVGETPNLAARLQGIAAPNMVVIAEGTRRLSGDLFELQDLGTKDLKGIAGPARAWAVLRAKSVESRFEALHTSGLTALVGRDEETELLLQRWTRAKTSEGQVVLLSGEAGIGKSRLTAQLMERLAAEPHRRLRYFCSPQHTDSALCPIISQMERAARLAHDDQPQTRLDKLDALLAQSSTPIEDGAHFAEMLSLANDGRYPALQSTPQQRRQKTLEALISQLEALAHSSPVLMIFEDAHWVDPTSLEALSRIVERIQALPVLLIVTFRSEFEPPWIGQPHVTAVTINRLTQRETAAMIDGVVGNNPLRASIRQDIVERTDGIPLFVEEMTKAVLEAESEGAAPRAVAAVPSPALAVPASLHASLMARLDRLGPAKEVVQIGAAIGRKFSHALLASVVLKPEKELTSALNRVVESNLLFRQGAPPYASYLFKHALVQDAAYGTLLRGPRRLLHAHIAETLESKFADIAESQPELLARHCTEAGLIEKAASLWGKAGQRSVQRGALAEATEQINRALGQIATLRATPALRQDEIKLQVALLNPLTHVKGSAAPETKAAVERARLLIEKAEALGEPPVDPLLLFSVLYGFWGASFNAFNGGVVRELAGQFLALAEKQDSTIPLMIGHRLMGSSLLLTGEIRESRAHLDRALAFYDPAKHRPLATHFGQDIGVSILLFRSFALWLLGYPEAALADADHALKDAREIGHAPTLMHALSNMSPMLCGDYVAASARLKDLIALADEKGALSVKIRGMSMHAHLLSLAGEASKAVQMMTSIIPSWRSTGSTVFIPMALLYLARAYMQLGQTNDAWLCIDEAIKAVEGTQERWFEAGIYHAAGEIALSHERDAAKAEAYFEHALAVAREQQAKSWELRAAMSMARLWGDQGQPQQGYDLLAPVYGWFTEGFDTLDLKDAKALLDELAKNNSRK
jgi:class 3 adenylate cyclase/predicted ATPase